MYNYQLKFKSTPPPVYAGFFNRTPFYISLSTDDPDYENLRINLYSQNSNSAPYQIPQNKWSHLLPQWGFYDYNGVHKEFVTPICESTVPDEGELVFLSPNQVDQNSMMLYNLSAIVQCTSLQTPPEDFYYTHNHIRNSSGLGGGYSYTLHPNPADIFSLTTDDFLGVAVANSQSVGGISANRVLTYSLENYGNFSLRLVFEQSSAIIDSGVDYVIASGHAVSPTDSTLLLANWTITSYWEPNPLSGLSTDMLEFTGENLLIVESLTASYNNPISPNCNLISAVGYQPELYITCASAYYVDSMPSTVNLIAVLETSGFSLTADNPEASLPSYSNSLIYDSVEYHVIESGIKYLNITQDGKNPIDFLKWTDTYIPFVATIHPDYKFPQINNNIYGLTAIKPISFTTPEENSESILSLGVSGLPLSSINWSTASSLQLTAFDEYGFNTGGFYRGYFISKDSIDRTVLNAEYSEILYNTDFETTDFRYINQTANSWFLSSNKYWYRNNPQQPIVLTSVLISPFSKFVLEFNYKFLEYESMGAGAEFLIRGSEFNGTPVESFDVIPVTSGDFTYFNEITTGPNPVYISLQLSSLFTGNFPFATNEEFRFGRHYISHDYGDSISKSFSPFGLVHRIAGSSSGQYQIMTVRGTFAQNGGLLISDDYGKTWRRANVQVTIDPSSLVWDYVAISGSGQYMLASRRTQNNQDALYRSNDYGVTWSPVPHPGRNRFPIISKNGQYQVFMRGWYPASTNPNLSAYDTIKSDDFGTNWYYISNAFGLFTQDGIISDDGQIISVVLNDFSGFSVDLPPGYLVVSQDGGFTWTWTQMPSSELVQSVCSTPDGMTQYIGTCKGWNLITPPLKIYKSTDGGQTVFDPNIDTSDFQSYIHAPWFSGVRIRCSSDQQYFCATVGRGHIYYSSDSGNTFNRVSNSFRSFWRDCYVSDDGQYSSFIASRLDEESYTEANPLAYDYRFNGFTLSDFSVYTEKLQNVSNEFQIKKFERPYEMRRFNESWDTGAVMHSYAIADHTFDNPMFFENFLEVSVGGLESNYQSLGRRMYERVANFVKNHADLDVCNLNQLYSLHNAIDCPIDDYRLGYPSEIRRLVDILSVNKNRLLGGFCKCNRNFFNTTSKCLYCGHRHSLNRETEAYRSFEYYVSANTPFVIENMFSTNDKYRYDILYPSVCELNGQPFALMSTIPAISWLTSADYPKYLMYNYVSTYCNDQEEGLINWGDTFTTLSSSITSSEMWYGKDGLVEEMLNYEIHRGLYNV